MDGDKVGAGLADGDRVHAGLAVEDKDGEGWQSGTRSLRGGWPETR